METVPFPLNLFTIWMPFKTNIRNNSKIPPKSLACFFCVSCLCIGLLLDSNKISILVGLGSYSL